MPTSYVVVQQLVAMRNSELIKPLSHLGPRTFTKSDLPNDGKTKKSTVRSGLPSYTIAQPQEKKRNVKYKSTHARAVCV